MKKKLFGVIALTMTTMMALSSCSYVKNAFNKVFDAIDNIAAPFAPPVTLTDAELNAERLIDFANGANSELFFESDGWTNGDVFNVVWKKDNVKYEDNVLKLNIIEEKAMAWVDDKEVEYNYTAGEARSQNYYGYGDYEVKMKPSANPGTASTFFTCTGPYDTKFVLDENGDYVLDENGQRVTKQNPHDEIDIEFLGKDTTHVQFNYFVNGVGGHEYMHNLGFDASKGFHEYGFRWEEDAITWFVDNVPVYKVTTDKTVTPAGNVVVTDVLPSTPGRILGNYWCGNERAEGWMGKYNGPTKDNGTEYQWFACSAKGAPLNPEEKPDEEMEGIDWSAIEAVAPTFQSTEKYVVVNEGTSSNVTYTEVSGNSYINVEMDVEEAAENKNYLHLTLANNAETDTQVRVNVVDSQLLASGAQNASTNQSATMDGAVVFTDLEWGGSFFDIPAGKTVEAVITFNGDVEKLQLMIDSSRNNGSMYAGNVTVSEIKFAKLGEIDIPEEPETPPVDPDEPAPELPVSGDLTTMVNGQEITFAGNVTDGYGVNANDENNTLTVAYNAIGGNSYRNIWADVSAIAGAKTAFTMKVTNNGAETAKVRVDVESQTQMNANTTACNQSATQDGNYAYTDLEWGGSMFEVAAGATVTIVVNYDASKLPTNVKIFVDTHTWDDEGVHTGEVVFSEMAFTGEYAPEEPETPPVEPETPPVEPELPGEELTFSAEAGTGYTIENNGKVVNLKYNGVGNSYKPVTAGAVELAAGKDTFTVTLKNNGAADARVRVDVQGTTWVPTGDGSGTDCCNVSATGGDVWTDTTWGGSHVTVPAGQEVTLVITYNENGSQGAVKNVLVFVDSSRGDGNTYNANVTLSKMEFSKVAQDAPANDSLTFVTGVYTITPNNEKTESLTVAYENISGGTYANVCSNVADIANENNAFTMTIKNNGAETVRVRIDLKATNQVGNTNVCNMQYEVGGTWTDLEWGGSFVEVASGAEVTVTVRYNPSGDFGAVQELLIYFDTSTYGDVNTYSGNLTINNFKFSKVEA